jgi:hypothetical protein
MVFKFCMLEPNICGVLIIEIFHVTLLAPRILRWLKFVHLHFRHLYQSIF